MYWAAENIVSTDPIEGGIEITEAQYQSALAGMVEGKQIIIENEQLMIVDTAKEELKTAIMEGE